MCALHALEGGRYTVHILYVGEEVSFLAKGLGTDLALVGLGTLVDHSHVLV